MMSYEESVAEIRRRKAAILQKKKSRIKKLTVVLTSLVLCIGIGAVSWMFGSDRKDALPSQSAPRRRHYRRTARADPS